MAKQKSIYTMKGTLDGVTFYKTKDGHLAKIKSSIDKKKIATDPKFARTRENGAEFGAAGKFGKILRDALREVLINGKDNRVVSRLSTTMLAIAKTDLTNTRGNRIASKGALELLKNFDFNINSKLSSTFHAPFTTTIDRVAGTLKLDIGAFVPRDYISVPQGATHFKIISASSEIDFLKEISSTNLQGTLYMPIDNNATAVISQIHNVTPNSTSPLFLLMGIHFFQSVNGQFYALRNGAFNPLSIVDMNKA